MKNKIQTLTLLSLLLLSAVVIGMISTAHANQSTAAGPIAFKFAQPVTFGGEVPNAMQQTSQAQQPMRSRQIIEEGIRVEVSGMLKKMSGGGWFLVVDQVLHQLYMAPAEIIESSGIVLKEGNQVMISGYFYSEEGEMTGVIAVNTIIIDGKEFRFREEDGTPTWRGRGSGGGARQPE